ALYGEDGNDSLVSGRGVTYLDGGTGDDTYSIRNDYVNDSTIADESGIDAIDLSSWAQPVGATISLQTAANVFQTLYSATPARTRLKFLAAEQIENVVGTPSADVIIGNSLANSLSGGDGSDTIVGQDNDDMLFGGGGDDALFGMSGDDVLDGG